MWTAPPAPSGRERPWWGLGDVLLSLPIIIIGAIIGFLVGLPFVDWGALGDADQPGSVGAEDLGMAVLATSLVGQQLAQGAWPIVVSRWKGLGPGPDWRLRFRWSDPFIGFGTAVIVVGLAAVVTTVMTDLVNLTDDAESTNTQFLVDAKGTPWLWVLLTGVVVGAPLVEEIFFRGLVLRAIEKRAGRVWAVVGSTVIFALPHFTGAGWQGTVVLLSTIATIGLVLAVVAVTVDRLGPTIIAHALFNALGAAGALGLFDGLAPHT